MLKYGFFNGLTGFFGSVVGAFPEVALPSDAMNVFNTVGEYVSVIAHYIPVDTFMICLTTFFSVWLLLIIISAALQLL